MQKIDCAVIGAGVVGLSVARHLAQAGREVVILEAENAIGTQTSSRNSEVIHAGISYPANSLKARLCVEGRDAMYAYCAERGIGHRRVGKLIVATTEDDMAGLKKYVDQGKAAGVHDLRAVDQDELKRMEPEVRAVAAVYSPSTGIVDSHGLMLAYLGDAENAGAVLALNSPVLGGEVTSDGIVLRVGGDEPMEVLCRDVVNAAGLYAQKVAGSLDGVPTPAIPPIHYAIGRYYTMSGKSPFTHLVYPVSRVSHLRVHVTLDLGGQCKFGPDLEWIDRVDYRFQDGAEADFYEGIRRYYPGLADGALQPGYTGIRPRLAGPNDPLHSGAADFVVQTPAVHGAKGLVNLFGIESPGLTSSIALGRYVAQKVAGAD
ncbi:NAD(P)/FAD-dependent oxidoreductase [Bordetella bronchialis]|uniref:FAD-dependent oxidoreductase n=1 Tax=Bordetella bronchialis TaxID=463025 RepID=A0A193FDY7_9BORD|nr:NAD(P)/FAD-dependent oxidoreductase [Bordetella bronchialis]ANN65982.1 FAD-dependent oxidoreductase [Bordetella bronchialis]ANN71066.1 FAD-dependent oxidoreductase [Bordetella bronchialis]